MRKLLLLCSATASLSVAAVGWNELATLARPDAKDMFLYDSDSKIQPSAFTNALFFDYDNDGNLDLLMMASGGDWNIKKDVKFMLLYRNLGAGGDFSFRRVPDSVTGFEQAADEAWLNPVAVGDVNADGYADIVAMTNSNGRHIDLYLNNGGDGSFTRLPVDHQAMTNGSVALGDIDGDGNLDILANGWSDSMGALGVAVYLGNGDGTFVKSDTLSLHGAFQGMSTLADMDGDGSLDIILTGHGNDWCRYATIYYNSSTPGNLKFNAVEAPSSGLPPVNLGSVLAADFNADGYMDLAMSGNDDKSETRVRMCYQDAAGKFSTDASYPIVAVNTDGAINMGDWDADGNMDIVVGGYLGTDAPAGCYSCPLRVYRNTSGANTAPLPPASVTAAAAADGCIEIRWTDGSDAQSPVEALRYNVYVRDNATGATSMLLPADTATGRLKVGTDLSVSVGSARKSYRIKVAGGDYTVGVQTLDQSFASSEFATAEVKVSGIADVTGDDSAMRVRVDGRTVTVASAHPEERDILIHRPDGKLCAVTVTNLPVELPATGIYIISSPARHFVRKIAVTSF